MDFFGILFSEKTSYLGNFSINNKTTKLLVFCVKLVKSLLFFFFLAYHFAVQTYLLFTLSFTVTFTALPHLSVFFFFKRTLASVRYGSFHNICFYVCFTQYWCRWVPMYLFNSVWLCCECSLIVRQTFMVYHLHICDTRFMQAMIS